MEIYFEDDDSIKKQIRDDIIKNLDSISKYVQDKYDEGKIDLLKNQLNKKVISVEYAVTELPAIN